MTKWILYHNPGCSKSREALEFLRERGLHFEIIEYMKTPLSEREVASLITELDGDLSHLVRQKEESFVAEPFDVNDPVLVARKIAAHPRLLERPLLRGDGRVTIGRPLENFRSRI